MRQPKIKVVLQVKTSSGDYKDMKMEFYNQKAMSNYIEKMEENGVKVIGILEKGEY